MKINKHIKNSISPIALDFTQDEYLCGEEYCQNLLISRYPADVGIGWLEKFANQKGVDFSISFQSSEADKLIKNISNSIVELETKLDAGGKPIAIQRATRQIESANDLLKRIDQDNEKLFYINILLRIKSHSKEELIKKSKSLKSYIASMGFGARSLKFLQEESFLHISPYGIKKREIEDIGNRNIPASTIGAGFPFNSSGINDGKGNILGKDNKGGIVLIDIWKRGGDRMNSNWSIFGSSGSGKSATMKKLILNEYSLGTKIILIDPEREYKELTQTLGGCWINATGGGSGKINPLEIKVFPDEEDGGISPLELHFQNVRTFFIQYLNINDIKMAYLERVLVSVYKKFDITFDDKEEEIKGKKFPIMMDLYEELKKEKENNSDNKDLNELFLLLEKASIGADRNIFNGQTNIKNSNADVVCFDTHDLQESDGNLKKAQYFNVLSLAWRELAKDRKQRVLLIVDEAHTLIDKENPRSMIYLKNFSKRARKYNSGIMVATQSVSDFMHESVRLEAQTLLDDSAYKMLLGTDGKNLESLKDLYDLTEAEQEILLRKNRGEGLFIAGSKRIRVNIKLSALELELMGSGGGK